jgi:hypothetical protein
VKKQHFPTFYRPKNQNKTPEATYTSEQSVFEAYFATLLSNQTYFGLKHTLILFFPSRPSKLLK